MPSVAAVIAFVVEPTENRVSGSTASGLPSSRTAVTASEQQFLPPDDGDRETGGVPVGDRLLDVGVELPGVELLERRNGSRPQHRREQQGRRTPEACAAVHEVLHPSS